MSHSFCFSLLRKETYVYSSLFLFHLLPKDIEEFKVHGRIVLSYDLGGHKNVRDVWKDYLVAAGCIVFVVDASDTERLADAKAELDVRRLSCLFSFFFTRLASFFLFFLDRRSSPTMIFGVFLSLCSGTSATSNAPCPSPIYATHWD